MREFNWPLLLLAILVGYFTVAGLGRQERANQKASDALDALMVVVDEVFDQNDRYRQLYGPVPDQVFSLPVTVTAYSATAAECDATPWVTASGKLSVVGGLAVSRDLLEEVGLYYGQTVVLEGYGTFVVQDTMNKRWTRRVDILMAHPEAARQFGIHEDIALKWGE